MNEQTRIKIIGCCTAVAIIWAGFNYNSDSTDSPDTPAKTIKALEPSAQQLHSNITSINVEKIDSLSWGRSPFYLASLTTSPRTATTSEQNQALSWILSGIIFSSSSPIAIINKKAVKIGDTIDKAIVTDINKEQVQIKYNQEKITLTVSKDKS